MMRQLITLAASHCLSFSSICLHAAGGVNDPSVYVCLFMCYGSYNKLIWWRCVTAIDPCVPQQRQLFNQETLANKVPTQKNTEEDIKMWQSSQIWFVFTLDADRIMKYVWKKHLWPESNTYFSSIIYQRRRGGLQYRQVPVNVKFLSG